MKSSQRFLALASAVLCVEALFAADAQGMVVILGYFYFGQDQRLRNEAAVIRATDEATRWLLDGGWRNVLVEVNNECNVAAYSSAPFTAAARFRRRTWCAPPTSCSSTATA